MTYFYKNKRARKPEEPAQYILKLTRKQAYTIFKTRTRMMKVKGNYKNAHRDLTCRKCGKEDESQEHVLNNCDRLIATRNNPITEKLIFEEDVNDLRQTATRIREIEESVNR